MLKKSRIIIISILIICVFNIASNVFAETKLGPIDLTQIANLTIEFSINSVPADNVEFKLYKVADIDEKCKFKLTKEFEKYPISLDNVDTDEWRKIALTVAAYVTADKLESNIKGNTDASGKIYFNDLELGLYLIIGNQYTTEEYIYTPTPVFICLPTYDKDLVWQYNIDTKIKYQTEKIPDEEETINKKVILVWDDNDDKESRPASIKIHLLKDGEIYDTIELSEENNWKHVWEGLSNKHKWQIVEAGMEDKYTTTLEEQGPTFVITKKYRENKPEDDKPEDEKPELPEEDDKEEPNKPNEKTEQEQNKPDKPEKPQDNMGADRLPATGVLWWPVPVLIIIGIILFAIGWIKRKGEEYEK